MARMGHRVTNVILIWTSIFIVGFRNFGVRVRVIMEMAPARVLLGVVKGIRAISSYSWMRAQSSLSESAKHVSSKNKLQSEYDTPENSALGVKPHAVRRSSHRVVARAASRDLVSAPLVLIWTTPNMA